ncbi:hypothetical protein HLRTI_003195 [Halorhabdus tiamatea SARL4B]|uniref:Uncharacterized protein n=1 Tax=Halorhabdus tiamatea SARL4B TaxID=1033806 RepID=U2DFG7_9EURY|nr:hypothetical protein [Halorhabdus tiamatea]ERJ04827.1 hypothetical protein HLRTI_003195 [Halorhabdus tiamatea SARL4B]
MSEEKGSAEFQTGDVEERIAGEFMRRLQESDVDFDVTEVMEAQLEKDDFGGGNEITELIEEEVLENED